MSLLVLLIVVAVLAYLAYRYLPSPINWIVVLLLIVLFLARSALL